MRDDVPPAAHRRSQRRGELTDAGAFSGGKATITGLTLGSTVWVCIRTLGLQNVKGAWSDPGEDHGGVTEGGTRKMQLAPSAAADARIGCASAVLLFDVRNFAVYF